MLPTNKLHPRIISSELGDSPLQQLHSPFLDKAGIQLLIKRDDLIHPYFGGNKWRKLKYNLIKADNSDFDTLLTFGGAWSNHIYATAAAGKHYGFKTIGMIRGEQHSPLNPSLAFASNCGMQLHYLSRTDYRLKHDPLFLKTLKEKFGNVYLLPEGGSNALALKGCTEIVSEIKQQQKTPFNIICCACGTGATLAGLVAAISSEQTAIGFSALKGGHFLVNEVRHFLEQYSTSHTKSTNWHIESRFHFGGYAKVNDELIQFIKKFQSEYKVQLDCVYTGKMFYGLFKLIESKALKRGTSIIAIHSGGLQGNKGFNL